MFGVKTKIDGVSMQDVKPLEDAILAVLGNADPTWNVSLIADQSGTWRLLAQPADGQSRQVVLSDEEHSPDAVGRILFGWYEEYKEARLL